MEKKILTLKDVVLNALRGNVTTIYYADEDAIWSILGLYTDKESSCNRSFLCKVVSCYSNGLKNEDHRYLYGDMSHFLFSKNDKFFLNKEDAEEERADVIAKAIAKADWLE